MMLPMLAFLAGAVKAATLLTDIQKIQKYWGEMTPYSDNAENLFGVEYVGLPAGCQVESVQLLQRHANRLPTSYDDDGIVQQNLAGKIVNYTAAHCAEFTGPLSFLNTYDYQMPDTGLLMGLGASTEFGLGVSFWQKYGRTLYNATSGQLAYNASYANGSARAPPLLRTTSQSRMQNSQINWALGFFGPSYQATPVHDFDPTADFEVLIISEAEEGVNNTLASYESCPQEADAVIGYLGDSDLWTYIPKYLQNATARLQEYAPSGFQFTVNDTYAMQGICAYEFSYLGASDFCNLFTADEWAGFENTLDIQYYYDYGFGNPTGRAQGIGYVQELLARLTSQLITTSSSSVNSTLDSSPTTFPLGQKFYADFSHDDIIISVLAALSLDYLHEAPTLTQFPPAANRSFILSALTPFGANLVTETIGCAAAAPAAVRASRVQYTPSQYGYEAANATSKFIRMRLNNGILPLSSIRGGACSGRPDGLCALGDFLRSQENATALANYQYACFGNYSVPDPTSGYDYDGTIFA